MFMRLIVAVLLLSAFACSKPAEPTSKVTLKPPEGLPSEGVKKPDKPAETAPPAADPVFFKTEQEVIAWIEKMNGTVKNGFQGGKEVNLSFTKVKGAELKNLALIKDITEFKMNFGTETPDAGLSYIAEIPTLVVLILEGPKITDASLDKLSSLANVKTLDLSQTKITDAGLKKLAPFHKLRELNLSQTGIGDEGIKNLSEIKGLPLENLYLGNTKITDASAKYFPPMEKLNRIYLYDTAIGDAVLKEIGKLKAVQNLELYKTNISDAGLKELAGCKSLTNVSVSEKSKTITPAGIEALEKSTGCTVRRDFR